MAVIPVWRVIAEVESGNNPRAVRFEGNVYMRLLASEALKHYDAVLTRVLGYRPSVATVAALCAISWGKFQILGQNLYAGWDGAGPLTRLDPFAFLQDEREQLEALRKFDERYLRVGVDRDFAGLSRAEIEALARRYNGPGNVAVYASRLREAHRRLAAG